MTVVMKPAGDVSCRSR